MQVHQCQYPIFLVEIIYIHIGDEIKGLVRSGSHGSCQMDTDLLFLIFLHNPSTITHKRLTSQQTSPYETRTVTHSFLRKSTIRKVSRFKNSCSQSFRINNNAPTLFTQIKGLC